MNVKLIRKEHFKFFFIMEIIDLVWLCPF